MTTCPKQHASPFSAELGHRGKTPWEMTGWGRSIVKLVPRSTSFHTILRRSVTGGYVTSGQKSIINAEPLYIVHNTTYPSGTSVKQHDLPGRTDTELSQHEVGFVLVSENCGDVLVIFTCNLELSYYNTSFRSKCYVVNMNSYFIHKLYDLFTFMSSRS